MPRLLSALSASVFVLVAAQGRSVRIDLACTAGCAADDSAQVAASLRTGLQSRSGGSHGRVVRTRVESSSSRSGPIATAPVPDLPLSVTGRITIDEGRVRVVAELFEGQRAVARDSIVAPREELQEQVKRLGQKFGSALADR